MSVNNLDTIPNYILFGILNIIFLWAVYKFTRPYKPDNKNTDCKCTK